MEMRLPQNDAIAALYAELEFASLVKKEMTGGTMDIDFEDVGAYSEPEAMPDAQADEIIDSIL